MSEPSGDSVVPVPVPHLTVTVRATDAVDAALHAALPVTTTPTEACLPGFDGTRWTTRHRFPFAA